MKESLDAFRSYVRFLHEHEGVRQVRLTRTARAGLARLAAAVKGAPEVPHVAAVYDRRTPLPSSVVAADRPSSVSPARPDSRHGPAPVTARPAAVPAALPVTEEPPIEISGSSKLEQLQNLSALASACVKCPHLAARRHSVVFGVGDPDAKLMFVGEGPGEEEDLRGEPFVGRAGQLLTKMIAAMGLAREQVYIGNVVKCRPDMPPGASGNRKPTREEMATCLPYLRAQIEIIKPTVLVALGATAVEGLVGPVGTIGSLRGKFLEYRGVPLMPTYHPSYLLRNQSNTEKRKVWEDLLKVMERLKMPISDKQRAFFLGK